MTAVGEPALRDYMADLVARAYRLESLAGDEDAPTVQYALGKADGFRGVVAELEDLIDCAGTSAARTA